MFAGIPLEWAEPRILLPTAIGLGAGFLAIVTIHFLTRSRPQPHQEAPKERPKDPDYDPFVQGSASEHRKAYRRTGNPVEVWVRNPATGLAPVRGHVLNRSTGGLCLGLEAMIAEGIVLEVRPANAPPITPWVEVEVRSCRHTNDGWEAGCQFVRTPPWALLLMFG